MKIAISTDGDYVSPHFGRCPSFTLAEVEEGQLIKKTEIQNPGHHPGFLPQFLSEQGVEVIVAGGMGRRAQDLFAESGIETVLGISGTVEETLRKILEGTLEGGESLCKPRSGKGYGVDKSQCDHGDLHSHEEGGS